MTPPEAIQLCRYVKALCPSQAFDEHTPKAWALVLDDIPFAAAEAAVSAIYKLPLGQQWTRKIEPAHIRDEVKASSNELLNRELANWTPPSGLTSDEYTAWQRDTIRRIKAGEQPDHLELEARQMPALGGVFPTIEGSAA